WFAYALISMLIIFRDTLASSARYVWAGLLLREPPDDFAAVEQALHAVRETSPTEMERAMDVLAASPAADVTPRLIELLGASDPSVGRRAARVLFERQDEAALPALFRWLAQHRP